VVILNPIKISLNQLNASFDNFNFALYPLNFELIFLCLHNFKTDPMENKPSTFTITLGYGVLIALALIVFALITYLVGANDSPWLVIVVGILIVGGIILAQINFRNKYLGGFMEYGKAFTIGFLTVLFLSILYAVYAYIFAKYIDPGAIEEQLAKAEQNMVSQGKSEEEIELGMKYASMFATPGLSAVGAFIMYTLFGTVVSLITSIFTKRENQGFNQPQV